METTTTWESMKTALRHDSEPSSSRFESSPIVDGANNSSISLSYKRVGAKTSRAASAAENDEDADLEAARGCGGDSSDASFSDSLLLLLFGVMGMGVLFPYNATITCVDWYRAVRPDVDLVARITSANFAGLLGTTLALLRFPPSDGRPAAVRVALGFALEAVVMVALSTIAGSGGAPSLLAVDALATSVGIGDAVAQSGVYVLAGARHPRFTAAVVTGSAVAGLSVSSLKLATKAIFPNDLNEDTRTFLLASGAVVVICLCALCKASSILRATREKECEKEKESANVADEQDRLVRDASRIPQSTNTSLTSETSIVEDSALREVNESSARSSTLEMYRQTLLVIWKPVFAVFLNFFVTLSLFPGPVSSITSSGLFGKWISVSLITAFNLFDLLGRILLNERVLRGRIPNALLSRRTEIPQTAVVRPHDLTGAPHFVNVDRMILWPSFARLVFFPLVVACHFPKAPILGQDLGRLAVVALTAATNGFAANACFMVGPAMMRSCCDLAPSSTVYDDRHRDAASLLLMLSSFLGLTAGAFFESVVDDVVARFSTTTTPS